jgi:CIC family chloride channel protein
MASPVPNAARAAPASARLRRRAEVAQRAVLRILTRVTPTEQSRVFAVTLIVGGLCGLVAVSFHLAIRFSESMLIERFPVDHGHAWIPWVLGVPTVGGLVAGVALKRFPGARGSGIPQVEAAYAIRTSKLRLRDAIAKFVICAVQVGSGASLGREGPTVQICASVATFVGRVFALSPSNQRRLIPVGAAAGIAAAFNAPLAAVTFVIEELVGGLDTTVLSGVVIAAALAAVVEHGVLGEDAIFQVPGTYGLTHASSLVLYAGLGVTAGVLGVAFVRALLALRAVFRRADRLPEVLKPAVGGFGTGCLAVAVALGVGRTGVTGGGYATLVEALHGGLVLRALAVLCVAKACATVLSYSSGGAGGIFAPSLFIGAMLGGLVGHADVAIFGHDAAAVGAFALVGMGAFFAAVVRAPITSILIIFEMTRSYRLVLPLMIANMVAYLISRRLQRLPIYEALLEQDGIQLPQGKSNVLATIGVEPTMTTAVVALEAQLLVDEALARVKDQPLSSYPVVEGVTFQGVLTLERLRRLAAEGRGATPLREHARVRESLHAGQTLRDALEVMTRLGVRTMVVVDRHDRRRVRGMLAMSDVMRALLRHEPAPESMSATGTPYPAPRSSAHATPPASTRG